MNHLKIFLFVLPVFLFPNCSGGSSSQQHLKLWQERLQGSFTTDNFFYTHHQSAAEGAFLAIGTALAYDQDSTVSIDRANNHHQWMFPVMFDMDSVRVTITMEGDGHHNGLVYSLVSVDDSTVGWGQSSGNFDATCAGIVTQGSYSNGDVVKLEFTITNKNYIKADDWLLPMIYNATGGATNTVYMNWTVTGYYTP